MNALEIQERIFQADLYRKLPDSISLTTTARDPFIGEMALVANKVHTGVSCAGLLSYEIIMDEGYGDKIKVGRIVLEVKKDTDFVYIEKLDNLTYSDEEKRSFFKKVGSAGLELAFRISHLVERKGNLQVFATSSSSSFYFLWGFAYFPSTSNVDRASDVTVVVSNALEAPSTRWTIEETPVLKADYLKGRMYLPSTEIERKRRDYCLL